MYGTYMQTHSLPAIQEQWPNRTNPSSTATQAVNDGSFKTIGMVCLTLEKSFDYICHKIVLTRDVRYYRPTDIIGRYWHKKINIGKYRYRFLKKLKMTKVACGMLYLVGKHFLLVQRQREINKHFV